MSRDTNSRPKRRGVGDARVPPSEWNQEANGPMKLLRGFFRGNLTVGALVVMPIYLAVVVLLKGMKSVATLVAPFTKLLPAWLPAEDLLSLLLVVAVYGPDRRVRPDAKYRVGSSGTGWRRRSRRSPAMGCLGASPSRSPAKAGENVWKPALVELSDALVPAFIIEENPDGRYTTFVPSVPTPLAGAVYILSRERVHPLNVPFTQAIKSVSRWGAGSGELVAAMTKTAP